MSDEVRPEVLHIAAPPQNWFDKSVK